VILGSAEKNLQWRNEGFAEWYAPKGDDANGATAKEAEQILRKTLLRTAPVGLRQRFLITAFAFGSGTRISLPLIAVIIKPFGTISAVPGIIGIRTIFPGFVFHFVLIGAIGPYRSGITRGYLVRHVALLVLNHSICLSHSYRGAEHE